jgi:hypothetical protein
MMIHPAIDRRDILRAVTLGMFILGAACAPAGDGAAGGDSAARAADSPGANQDPTRMATILSPAEGDTVGPDITVTLGATGVTIEKASGIRTEGIGHHHLFLDDNATPADQPIPPATPTTVHLGTGANEHTFRGVAPGPHRIIAVLAYGDHVPMVGVRADTVNVVVKR